MVVIVVPREMQRKYTMERNTPLDRKHFEPGMGMHYAEALAGLVNFMARRDIYTADVMDQNALYWQAQSLEMQHDATHDALTGLPNRRSADAHIARYLETASDESTAIVGIIDIDKFKLVNDTFGHGNGDRALIKLSENLRKVIRDRDDSDDFVARVGGDEFFILYSIGGDVDIPLLHQRLKRRINSKLIIDLEDGSRIRFSASIGIVPFAVAELRSYGGDIDVIKELADKSMYAEKNDSQSRAPVLLPPTE